MHRFWGFEVALFHERWKERDIFYIVVMSWVKANDALQMIHQ
jgi:hypothetical protein